MRQVVIRVPLQSSSKASQILQDYEAVNVIHHDATNGEQAVHVVNALVSNSVAGDLIQALHQIPEVHITMPPQEVFFFKPPDTEVPQQLTNVQPRSPIEIFLGGLQSIGSWKGFLGYAIGAACLVWIGFFTNSISLLIAGMLVSPFAGPAMNVAIATARGDSKLLRRSLLRYLAALVTVAFVAGGLSLTLGRNIRTTEMVRFSEISETAVLLPLVVGAVGAINLIQSERNSLVSGTAVGVLVGASLAPPAALIGIGLVLQETNILKSALFLVILQLLGINLAGVIIFRLAGLSHDMGHYQRGARWLTPLTVGLTLLLLTVLLVWQFSAPPDLQRSSQAQRAATDVQQIVNEFPGVELIEADARFTRADIEGQNSLLIIVYVQRVADAQSSAEEMRAQLTQTILTKLNQEYTDVTPLVDVVVLEALG